MGALLPLQFSIARDAESPLAGLSACIHHDAVNYISGASGSGKTTLVTNIMKALTHQLAWLDQVSCRTPLKPFSPSDSTTSISGGRPFIYFASLAECLRNKTEIKDFFQFLHPDSLIPTTCPACAHSTVVEISTKGLAQFLVSKHSGALCTITTQLPGKSRMTFDSVDELLETLPTYDLAGRSYIYINGSTLDLDDSNECDQLFPLSLTDPLEVVEERLIIRAEQTNRIEEVFASLISKQASIALHVSNTYYINSEKNWFCSHCNIHEADSEVDISRTVRDIIDQQTAISSDLFSNEILSLPLTSDIASISRSFQQQLFLFASTKEAPTHTLLIFDHDVLPARNSKGLLEECLLLLSKKRNTVVVCSADLPIKGTHSISLSEPVADFADALQTLPVEPGGLFRASNHRGVLQKAITGERFSLTDLLSDLSWAVDLTTPVRYHSLQIGATDKNRTISSIPGLCSALVKLYASLPQAKENGLKESQLRKAFLAPGDDQPLTLAEARFKGFSIIDLANQTIMNANEILQAIPRCSKPLAMLQAAGLDHSPLSRSLADLSFGEAIKYSLARLMLTSPRGTVILAPDYASIFGSKAHKDVLDRLQPLAKKCRITILFCID